MGQSGMTHRKPLAYTILLAWLLLCLFVSEIAFQRPLGGGENAAAIAFSLIIIPAVAPLMEAKLNLQYTVAYVAIAAVGLAFLTDRFFGYF